MADSKSNEPPVSEVKLRRIRESARGQQILEVASQAFLSKGYDATSIQEIADEVGVLKGSLYYYITGKEDLLFAIIEDVHRGGAELLAAAQKSSGTVEEQFHDFLMSYVSYSAQILVKAAIFDLEFRALSPEMRRQILAQRKAFDDYLTKLIISGQEAGVFRQEVIPSVAVSSIYLTINGLHRWYRSEDLSIDDVVQQYTEFFLRALRKPSRRYDVTPSH